MKIFESFTYTTKGKNIGFFTITQSFLPKVLFMLLVLIFMTSCSDDDTEPIAQDPIFIDLNMTGAENLYPEGIIVADNGDIYVSGFGDIASGNGSVIRIPNGTTTAEYFKNEGEDGLLSAVGMEIDQARNRLFVANANLGAGTSDLKIFDLTTGNLIKTITHPSHGFTFFNEIAIDASGRVYISDTGDAVIWTVASNTDDANLPNEAEVFVTDPLLANPDPNRAFGLNGLNITADGNYLIASVMDRLDQGDGRLVSINISSKTVTDVNFTGQSNAIQAFAGSDGMFFNENLLYMVNVVPPASIITAQFNADYTSAELVQRGEFESSYNRPTASAIKDGRLWTVNSQLDHVIDDNNGAVGTNPDLPFQIVGVPINVLLQ